MCYLDMTSEKRVCQALADEKQKVMILLFMLLNWGDIVFS